MTLEQKERIVNYLIGYPESIDESFTTQMCRRSILETIEYVENRLWHDAKKDPPEHFGEYLVITTEGSYDFAFFDTIRLWQTSRIKHLKPRLWCDISYILPSNEHKNQKNKRK